MKTAPPVTVLLPVLNPDPVFFPQAVASILRQTLPDFELLIVEDPSPRPAGELMASLTDPRVRLIVNPRRTSLVDQLNQGLAEARGAWVARMDADDIAEPERLARQAAFLDSHPEVGAVGSQVNIINPAGRHLGYRVYPTEHRDIVRSLRRVCTLAHPAVMLRKEVVLRLGGYRAELYPAEDFELWCRLAVNGVRLANLPEPLLRYRTHPGATKAARLRDMLRATVRVKELYWEGQMDWGDRLRLWGERLLQGLPPRLVLKIFLAFQYRNRLPLFPK